MKAERLAKIAAVMKGRLVPKEAGEVYARGVSVDSRTIAPGEVFFALKGKRDGHDFVSHAYQNGAIAAVVERKVDVDIPQIIVDDTLFALGELAKEYRRTLNPKTIGITGSVGKTTTREMIAKILATKYTTHSAKKNYNNLIGLPLTILEMGEDVEFAVVELGINTVGEMERLSEIAAPDVAVITSIAPVHTEGLGSVENILSEKVKITNHMPPDSPVIINADCDELVSVADKINRRVITFGINRGDYKPIELSFVDGKASFTFRGISFKLNALGRGAVYSALAAIAVADFFDVPLVIASKALELFEPPPSRLNLIKAGNVTIIDDSYNSNPVALDEALDVLAMLDAKRKVAVLGDMLELGEYEEMYHRKVADLIKKHGVDVAFLFGPRMELANARALEMGLDSKILWFVDPEKLETQLLEEVRDGDLILVKGSNAMGMKRFVESLIGRFGLKRGDEEE